MRTIFLGLIGAAAVVVLALIVTPEHQVPPRLGTIAKFTPAPTQQPAPRIQFTAADGGSKTLADFAGRALLVNFWATWCAPCVQEMPSLMRLAQRDDAHLAVIAVSEDRQGWPVMTPFLAKLGLGALPVFHDPGGSAGVALAVSALPTTVLFGPDGREIGRFIGPAEWDGPETAALLRRYVGG